MNFKTLSSDVSSCKNINKQENSNRIQPYLSIKFGMDKNEKNGHKKLNGKKKNTDYAGNRKGLLSWKVTDIYSWACAPVNLWFVLYIKVSFSFFVKLWWTISITFLVECWKHLRKIVSAGRQCNFLHTPQHFDHI